MADYLVREEDGTSKLLLEEGGGDALLLDVRTVPPGWSHVGSLGCASEYNFSKYTMEISPSSDVPAGDIVVIWVAWTSHYFFGPDGTVLSELSCVDDAGNRYLELHSAYGERELAAMFIGQLRNDLLTTDTITLKSYGPGAKAACAEQFTLEAGKRWAFALDQRAFIDRNVGDPWPIAVSGLEPARDYLLLHVLGSYGQTTDTYTWDADYTQITGAGTTGHGNPGGTPPPGDVQLLGGWRIATGISGDTVDVTATGPLRDNGQGLVAIAMLDPDDDYASFPNTPLLDDFNRANEDPIDGSGTWDKTSIHGRPGFGFALVRVVSNQAAMSALGGGGSGSEWMLDLVTTEDSFGEYEEWGTLTVVGDAEMFFGAGNGQAADLDANAVGYRDAGVRAFNATAVPMGLTYFGGAGFTGEIPGVGGLVWGPLANGTKIGMQQLTQDLWTLHLWMDDGGGWEWVCAISKSSFVDFVAQGRFGLGFEGDTSTRLDDFGGGPLERALPQIFRRIWAP